MRFDCRPARVAAAVAAALVAVSALPAYAAENVQGLVLSVLTAQGEAVVRHDPYGGMPAMTMVFRVEPKSVSRDCKAGDRIEARTDMSADEPRLDDVRVVGGVAGGVARAVHDVPPLNVGDSMPQTEFFDQLGRGFSFTDFRGQTVVLAFIYTRCRDPRMCPLVSANFHLLQTQTRGFARASGRDHARSGLRHARRAGELRPPLRRRSQRVGRSGPDRTTSSTISRRSSASRCSPIRWPV